MRGLFAGGCVTVTDIGWNIKGKLASHVTMAYMLGQMPACSDRGQRDRTVSLEKTHSAGLSGLLQTPGQGQPRFSCYTVHERCDIITLEHRSTKYDTF